MVSIRALLSRRRVRRLIAWPVRRLRPVRRLLRRGPLEPSQIRVSWTGDPARSLAIRWNARAARTASSVEIRPLGADTWRRITAQAMPAIGCGGWIYHCAVGELDPDTTYEYRLSRGSNSDARWSAVHRVRTAPSPSQGFFRAVFFADVGVAAGPTVWRTPLRAWSARSSPMRRRSHWAGRLRVRGHRSAVRRPGRCDRCMVQSDATPFCDCPVHAGARKSRDHARRRLRRVGGPTCTSGG